MTWGDFKEKLERAGLTVGLFAEMVGVSKGSIYTWSNRKIPYWVESWLDNYIRANEYQELIFELILALDALYKSLKKTISYTRKKLHRVFHRLFSRSLALLVLHKIQP